MRERGRPGYLLGLMAQEDLDQIYGISYILLRSISAARSL
jgi:hypothetical protein